MSACTMLNTGKELGVSSGPGKGEVLLEEHGRHHTQSFCKAIPRNEGALFLGPAVFQSSASRSTVSCQPGAAGLEVGLELGCFNLGKKGRVSWWDSQLQFCTCTIPTQAHSVGSLKAAPLRAMLWKRPVKGSTCVMDTAEYSC